MRITYISGPALADCDFPLIKQYQEDGHEVQIFYILAPQSLRSTLFNIKKQKPVNDVIKALEYPEYAVYSNYIDMDNFYLLHRTNMHAVSLNYFKIVLKELKLISEFDPDVVHIMVPPYSMDALLYRFRKKLVLTMHDPFPHSGESSFLRTLFRNLSFKLCPKFVLLNEVQKEQFMDTYHINDNQILINKLGSYDCIKVFQNECTSQNKKRVLFFGRISKYKGIEYLLEAMKQVHQVVPDADVVVAGGGKMYFDITEYESLDYVRIINRYVGTEELSGLINECSIVVCPYTDATQSGVINTAFALNKPVVATNVGALGEYIQEGITGKLVPPKDPTQLASAIIELLTDQDRLSIMSNNIKAMNLTGEGSWKTIAGKYYEFYKK